MIIQSKKVWIADQFISAAVELEQGKITGIFPYGESRPMWTMAPSASCPVLWISTAMVPTSSTPTTQSRRACATGQSISSLRCDQLSGHYRHPERGGADQRRGQCGRRDGGSYEGAEILGIHFEGPYLDMKYKAHSLRSTSQSPAWSSSSTTSRQHAATSAM